MLDLLRAHIGEFLTTFVAGGAAGSLITLRLSKKKTINAGGAHTDQRGASAGRDMIGGDSTKK
jgi:hypothetical protein